MNINIDINHNAQDSARFDIGLAAHYLPVKLCSTSFDTIGECVAFLANNADGQFTNICVDDDSVLFIIEWSQYLYDTIQKSVCDMQYWSPIYNFHRVSGVVDGYKRTIYLDSRSFRKIVPASKVSEPHKKTINQFSSHEVLFPCIAYVSTDFKEIFTCSPIFASKDGLSIQNGEISAKVEPNLLQYYQYMNKCALKGYNRFYDRYEPTNMLGTKYLIYTEEGFELIRRYYYDLYDEATAEILSDKVVGAITILETPPFEKKVNSITLFLTTERLNIQRATNVDMSTTTYDNHPMTLLKYQNTKVLTLACLHYILKKYDFQLNNHTINYNDLGGWRDFMTECENNGTISDFSKVMSSPKTRAKQSMDSLVYELRHNEESFKVFENFIEQRFWDMDSFDRATCAIILPKYKDIK